MKDTIPGKQRHFVTHVALFVIAIAALVAYLRCGGSSGFVVTVMDRNGSPIVGATVLIGPPAAPSAQGTTDGSGNADLPSGALGDSAMITAGAPGYRSYAAAAVDASAVSMTLNELVRPHGYIRASIDDSTWGDLADDIPQQIYRFAWVMAPLEDMTDTMDSTDCDACMKNDTLVVPGIAGDESLILPAFVSSTRAFAFAGLLDMVNLTVTVYKVGVGTFSISESNTPENPGDVSIPLSYDVGDGTSITMDVQADFPPLTDQDFQVVVVGLQDNSFGLMGIVTDIAVGGTKVGEHSYRFKALDSDLLPEGAEISPTSTYRTGAGYGDHLELVESFRVDTLPVTNTAQTVNVATLLDPPRGISPAEGETIPLGDTLTISWNEVEGAEIYTVLLGAPSFDGLEIGDNVLWQGIAPQGTTSMTLRTDEWAGFSGLASCSAYGVTVGAIAAEGYDYSGGDYPRFFDILFFHNPALNASNQAIFFTEGEGCGPIISRIWPYEGTGGTEVTITGINFGEGQGTSVVQFGSNEATEIVSWSNSQIVAKVPAGTADDVVELKVTAGGVTSNAAYFYYQPVNP